ncbi:rho GTPase-activating protein 24 isoform X1 [Antennarius striatus]|uniref:rho GTPase-activating protein 24 isoform X1 n=1 Tax=Antennarius striatus TaxID=241820 RepID=UPI0035B27E44
MELHYLPTETPTTASSCSTDPLYDNCVPFAQRGRAREREMESRVVCPDVTRLPGPRSPLPALAPAEVPTLVSGERGIGTWPDHNYCSWRGCLGILDWEAELDTNVNRTRGGEGAPEGGSRGVEDRAHLNQSPDPSHRSVLSLYDNLRETVTPDRQEVFDMETSFREQLQEQMYKVWALEEVEGMMDDEGLNEDTSLWSSCEIILADGGCYKQEHNPEQDKTHKEELDSGSSGFREADTIPHLKLPVSPPQLSVGNVPQLSQTEWPSAGAQHAEQRSWTPRVPPPVPLADPSASALRSLITGLQQQIIRQRDEYEARVASLEQRNEELQAEVVRLKMNLSQQQHWYQAVQAKIVESEKERTAAELRNATLQKEMEQFFDTFGELNNEAKKTECIVKSF